MQICVALNQVFILARVGSKSHHLDFVSAALQPVSPSQSLLFADDNSNQSSIADASPIKQENSSNSSPVPEQNSTGQVDGPGSKSDDTPTDAKEEAGSEGNHGVVRLKSKLDIKARKFIKKISTGFHSSFS